MINHYFKLAKRALSKNKYYTLINIFGLVFGMLSALIIAKYIGGSLRFDSFHEKRDKIFSITQQEFVNDNRQENNSTYWAVGELMNQFHEVAITSRYSYHVESLVIADDEKGNKVSFVENNIFSADSGFFDMFTFQFIEGDRKTALSKPHAVVLTQSASQRYFKGANPIGKTLVVRVPWGLETTYEVTGIIEDVPSRSQFKFDFLLSRTSPDPNEFWNTPDYATFLIVNDDADINALSQKITDALKQVPQLTSANKKVVVSLAALANVQLTMTEYMLIAVGIFIVLISWVNYINQVIAQSYWRMKEIEILRVMGATRTNLQAQFAVESAITCITAVILIIAVYVFVEPSLQSLTGGHLLPLVDDPTPINLIFLGIFMMGIILATGIPAVIFISKHFGMALRGSLDNKMGGITTRKALVILQFSISTVLVIGVFVISNQLEYMTSKDKGMNMDEVLIIQAPIARDTSWNVKRKTVELFKEQCAQLPFIEKVASSTTVPGEEYRWETYLSLQGNTTKSLVHQNGVDGHFLDLYEVRFLAGHNFITEAKWKNRNSIILNESAARALGITDFENAINAKIIDHESDEVYDLIGIVGDYHQTSLKYKMEPIAFRFNEVRGHFSLKINERSLAEYQLEKVLASLKELWSATYPDVSFESFFLDQKFAAQDRQDRYFGKLFNYFTILSVVISCLGLFGFSLLISTKRQKEIGVRKVFGASSFAILIIFLRSYLGSLSIAMIIGTPVGYQLMRVWLTNYAYRTEIGMDVILTALISLTLVFLLTIMYHTLRSSVSNPVTILRS